MRCVLLLLLLIVLMVLVLLVQLLLLLLLLLLVVLVLVVVLGAVLLPVPDQQALSLRLSGHCGVDGDGLEVVLVVAVHDLEGEVMLADVSGPRERKEGREERIFHKKHTQKSSVVKCTFPICVLQTYKQTNKAAAYSRRSCHKCVRACVRVPCLLEGNPDAALGMRRHVTQPIAVGRPAVRVVVVVLVVVLEVVRALAADAPPLVLHPQPAHVNSLVGLVQRALHHILHLPAAVPPVPMAVHPVPVPTMAVHPVHPVRLAWP